MPDEFELEMLERFVAGRDVPCPGCGYSLRNLKNGRCPECGDELVLRINHAEPRQGMFLAGLIGLVLGLGFNGTFLILVGVLWLTSGYAPGIDEWYPLIIFSAVLGAGLYFWLRFRSAIRRAPTWLERTLVFLSWAVSVMSAVVFFAIAA